MRAELTRRWGGAGAGRAWWLVFTLGLVGLFALLPGRAQAGYEWVREWPVPDEASGIAVGSKGVYITQGGTALDEPSMQRYSPRGDLLDQWGDVGTDPGQLTDPSDVELDPSGRVWVVDGFGEIIVYTARGARVGYHSILDSCNEHGEILLHGIEIDPIGDVYFPFYDNCNLPGETREGVIRAHTDWRILGDWGESGPADGQFSSPGAVASDGRGNVYVADSGNYRIQQFTPDGTFVRKWGQLGSKPGQFNGLGAVEIGPGGDLFAVDRSNERIQRFAPNGKFIEQFGIPEGVEYSGLPADLDFDSRGNLYLLGTEGYETVDEVHVFGRSSGRSGAAIPKQRLRFRKGGIKVELTCSAAGPCAGRLLIRKGKRVKLAKGRYKLAAGARRKAAAKVTKRGRALLRRGGSVKVTVELRPKGGGGKVTKRLPLRG